MNAYGKFRGMTWIQVRWLRSGMISYGGDALNPGGEVLLGGDGQAVLAVGCRRREAPETLNAKS